MTFIQPTFFKHWKDWKPGFWPWPNFPPSELACSHCDALLVDPYALNRLQAIRWLLDFPLPLNSAYRCPKHNDDVSDTGPEGPHTTGRAFDIEACFGNADQILEIAHALRVPGIGPKQHGPIGARFVHLDWCERTPDLPRPAFWTYA